MGALSYTLAGTDALKLIAELNPRDSDNDELLLRRLAPFLLAGPHGAAAGLDDVARELDGEPPSGHDPPQERRMLITVAVDRSPPSSSHWRSPTSTSPASWWIAALAALLAGGCATALIAAASRRCARRWRSSSFARRC